MPIFAKISVVNCKSGVKNFINYGNMRKIANDKSVIRLPRQDFEVKPYSWLLWGGLGHTVANEQDFCYGKTMNDGMKRGKCKNDKSTIRLLGQLT